MWPGNTRTYWVVALVLEGSFRSSWVVDGVLSGRCSAPGITGTEWGGAPVEYQSGR